jgi:hypothetical protein
MRLRKNRRRTDYPAWRSQYAEAEGADYAPFLTVREVRSRGTSVRKRSLLCDRMYELLSLNESHVVTQEEWDGRTVDLREQYALDPEETQEIAHELGIRHPRSPRDHVACVMTTDLLVTKRSDLGPYSLAIAVKDARDPLTPRTKQKLCIEEEYWARRQVNYDRRIADESLSVFARNVEWLRRYDRLSTDKLLPTLGAAFLPQLAMYLCGATGTLGQLCGRVDSEQGAPPGSALQVLRMLLASQQWTADLTTLVHPCKPIVGFSPQPPPRAAR